MCGWNSTHIRNDKHFKEKDYSNLKWWNCGTADHILREWTRPKKLEVIISSKSNYYLNTFPENQSKFLKLVLLKAGTEHPNEKEQ